MITLTETTVNRTLQALDKAMMHQALAIRWRLASVALPMVSKTATKAGLTADSHERLMRDYLAVVRTALGESEIPPI